MSLIRGRCYAFKNIFAPKNGEKIGGVYSKYLNLGRKR
jgi:hypothetical protein